MASALDILFAAALGDYDATEATGQDDPAPVSHLQPEPESEPVPRTTAEEDAMMVLDFAEHALLPPLPIDPTPATAHTPAPTPATAEEEEDGEKTDEDTSLAVDDTPRIAQVAGVKRKREQGDEGEPEVPAEIAKQGPTMATFAPHVTFKASVSAPHLETASLKLHFPPPLPSRDPVPVPTATKSESIPHLVPEDSGIIRCVCPFTSDDGFTIQCDTCNVWQHAACVNILPEDVPDEYLCELCDPGAAGERGVDSKKAEEGMRRRMEAEAITRARTGGTLNPTPAGAGRGAKPKRGLTADEGPQSATGEATTTTTVKRRRGGKQPAGVGRGRGASTVVSAPTTPGATEAQLGPAGETATPRLASLGSLRAAPPSAATTTTTNVGAAPPSEDEDLGDDAYESWQYEYTPVEKNLYRDRGLVARLASLLGPAGQAAASELADLWKRQTAHKPIPPVKDSLVRLLFDTAPTIVDVLPPPASIKVSPVPSTSFQLSAPVATSYLPTSQTPTCPYPRSTTHALFTTAPIPANTFISTLKGQVVPLEDYRRDPLNQYTALGVPKQGVRLLPQPWSLAIDMRRFGNEVRFARSGCHANAVVRVLQVKHASNTEEGEDRPTTMTTAGRGSRASTPWADQARGEELVDLVFAIYSTVDIGKKEEIVLPWDWDDDHIVHSLPALMNAPPFPTGIDTPDLEPLSKKMAQVTTTILGTSQCACEKKRDCALYWMTRAASAANTGVARGAQAQAKREPFATLFLNALGNAKEGEGAQGVKTKARKVKKPDCGALLGLERGWFAKWKPAAVVVEPEAVPPACEEETTGETSIEIDAVPESTLAMDVDPTPPVPVPDSSMKARRASVSSAEGARSRPPVIEDGDETDDSDLTEPLSEPPSENEVEEEEAEKVVQPPARRKPVTVVKRTAKDVGPGRKRLLDPAKARKKDGAKGSDREEGGKKIKKKNSVVIVKKVAVDKSTTADASHRKPSAPAPAVQPPQASTSSSSVKPSIPAATPAPEPAESALAAELFVEPEEKGTEVVAPPEPAKRRRMTLEDYRKRRQSDAAETPTSTVQISPIATSVPVAEQERSETSPLTPLEESAAPTVDPEPTPVATKEPTPPPAPEPEKVKPPPRARLSLAAYRQRQQELKESETTTVSTAGSTSAVPVATSHLVQTPAAIEETTITQSMPEQMGSAATSEEIVSTTLSSRPGSSAGYSQPSMSADDILRRLGDYFSSQQSSATIPAPASAVPVAAPVPAVVAPMPMLAPPPRRSSTPPRPPPVAQLVEPATPPRPAPRRSPSYPSIAHNPAPQNDFNDFRRSSAPQSYPSSSYRRSDTPPLPNPRLMREYSPPRGGPSSYERRDERPVDSGYGSRASPPSSYPSARPSPPSRPYERDIPTGPRGRGSFISRGGYSSRVTAETMATPSSYASGSNAASTGTPYGGSSRARGYRGVSSEGGRGGWSGTPVSYRGSPAPRARYDGVPRGPAAMRGSGRGSLPPPGPGWRGRGRGRGSS